MRSKIENDIDPLKYLIRAVVFIALLAFFFACNQYGIDKQQNYLEQIK